MAIPPAFPSKKKELKAALAAARRGKQSRVPCAHPWGAVRYIPTSAKVIRQIESDAGKTLSERRV